MSIFNTKELLDNPVLVAARSLEVWATLAAKDRIFRDMEASAAKIEHSAHVVAYHNRRYYSAIKSREDRWGEFLTILTRTYIKN